MINRGKAAMIIGIALIFGALSLEIYNVWDDKRASSSADTALINIEQIIETNGKAPSEVNHANDSVKIADTDYIGIIDLPSIKITLPVLSTWSYPHLRLAPCRYSGSLADSNLVIAGHNYSRHFGKIGNMAVGDTVFFTNTKGCVYEYAVAEIDTLQRNQTKEMTDSQWDLTLFTCNYAGTKRTTVRCKFIGLSTKQIS